MERYFLVLLVLALSFSHEADAVLSGQVKLYNTTSYKDEDHSYNNESVLARFVLAYRNESGFYANTRFFTRYNFKEGDFSKVKNYNYVGFNKRINDGLLLDMGMINCLKYGCEVFGGKESFDITNVYVGASINSDTLIYLYYRDEFLSSLPARYFLEVEHYFRTETYTYGIGFWHIQPLADGWKWNVADKSNQTIWASVSRKWNGVTYEAHVRAETLKKGDWVLNSNTKPSLDFMVSKPFKL